METAGADVVEGAVVPVARLSVVGGAVVAVAAWVVAATVVRVTTDGGTAGDAAVVAVADFAGADVGVELEPQPLISMSPTTADRRIRPRMHPAASQARRRVGRAPAPPTRSRRVGDDDSRFISVSSEARHGPHESTREPQCFGEE